MHKHWRPEEANTYTPNLENKSNTQLREPEVEEASVITQYKNQWGYWNLLSADFSYNILSTFTENPAENLTFQVK